MNFFNKADKKEYVVAILLRHNDGQGFLLEVIEAKRSVKIIDQRSFVYTNSWENLTYDIDELLFNLENDHKVELKKAAFFVYSHLVDLSTREILEQYKAPLEKIIKDNEIEALGYLEMDQIISKYITEKESSPLSATVIEIDTPAVSVFMYQGGELIFSESVSRSEDIVADLTELFQHTQKDTVMPSRLVMYDSGGIQEEASKVISHKWPKEVFMHVPKVDVITETDIQNAILKASPEYLFSSEGYSAEAPVIMAPVEEIVQEQESMYETESVPEDLGFIIGEDVKKSHLPEPAGSDVYESPMQTQPATATAPSFVNKIKNLIHMPKLTMPNASRKKTLIIGIVFLMMIGSLIAGLYYLHSATLTIYYEKSEISQSVDFENADFIQKKTENLDTEASIETSGTKKVGEKASGSVTIFNATESDKTFKKATKLTAPNKLVFILDNDVTVKAATKTVTSGGDILTTTSKVNANVTAEEIGTTHNLGKDTKFVFEGSSDTTYFAKSTEAFTGGSEKEIQTASKEDFTRIKTEIEEQINKKKADALKESDTTQKVLNELTEVELTKEDYSKELAEEAKTLDAKVTAEVSYYLYDDEVVKEALLAKLADQIPENYLLKPEDITFTVTSSEKTDDGVNLSLEIKGEPSYKVDEKATIALIKGKTIGSVEKKLKENVDSKGYSVEVISPIPFFKFFTPLFDKNYKITTEPLE